MSFIFWTIWIIFIAVVVNILMEQWHARRADHYRPPHNEAGSLQIIPEAKHRR